MKKLTVKVRKPSTGTDCKMSSAGMMISSARRLLAASVATVKVKTSDTTIAASMRSVVRSAYSGRCATSSETGACDSASSGARIPAAACTASTIAAMISANAMRS
jgi:hypothetical protein